MSAFLDRLSPRDRRAILLGLAVLAPALLWAAVIRPYRAALADVKDRIAAERALLAREEALLANANVLPEVILDAAQGARRAEQRLVRAPSLALAETELTDHIERLAEASRVLLEDIRSIQPERTEQPPPGLGLIRIGINGESDLNGVAKFLQRIEQGQYLLNVRELQIEPVMERPRPTGSRGRREAPREPQPTGVVQFSITLEAYTPADPAGERSAVPEAP